MKKRPDSFAVLVVCVPLTGDFRYSPEMCNYAALQPFMCGPSTALDAVYLDNTFGTPQAAFPSQLEVLHLPCLRIPSLPCETQT